MARLAGKVAVITGSSRGIGRGIALKFGREGAKVVVNYQGNREKAEAVVRDIVAEGSDALAVQADMSDVQQIERLMTRAVDHYGKLNILVSNAGIELFKALAEVTVEDFDHLFAINTRGQFFAAQQAAKRMEDGGRIIFTSSISVTRGIAGHSLYPASKAAVEIFARNLAVELGPRAITVNAIAPGATTSDMSAAYSSSYSNPSSTLGRLGTPEDIANVVAFLVSEEGSWINGQTIYATGGFGL